MSSYTSLFGYGKPTYSIKDSILSKLRELGATRMEASYSGGNDEGGVNDVVVLRPRGRSDYLLHSVRERGKYEGGQKVGVEEVIDQYPVAGPYSTKKEAISARRKVLKESEWMKNSGVIRLEPVKATGDLVRLFGVEGDWDDEDSLYSLVDSLLEGDFGSWAGEFSAHGKVYATVKDGRVWREGETSHMSWDSSGGDY